MTMTPETDDNTVEEKQAPTPAPAPAPIPPKPAPAALAQLENDEAQTIYDFLSELGSTGEMKVELLRKTPMRYKGVKTDGLLETYHEPITYDQIQEIWGGGKYQVRVHRRSASGRWSYAGARTFDIAGHPRLDALINEDDDDDDMSSAPPAAMHESGTVSQAMQLAHQLVRDSREEARTLRDQSRREKPRDEETTMVMIRGLQEELRAARKEASEKDQRILELINRKPDTSSQDKLFGIMREQTNDHSSRINEVRLAHDSELRQLRDFHQQELRNRESRFEKELDAVRAGHSREIDSLKESHRSAMESQRNGYEMRMDGLKESVKRLEREVGEARTEVAGLRAKKEQGPLEQIQGLVSLKSGLESLMPQGDDSPPSTFEKVVSALSPLAEGVAARFAGAPEQKPQQQLPAGQQMVSVKRPNGEIVQVPRSYIEQMRERQAQSQAKSIPSISPIEVKTAVSFIEQAYRNGHPPETVAASARNLVPSKILDYIKSEGVDQFLNNVAKLDDSSPLATVAGRIYVRKIAKFLLEGTTDLGNEEPVEEPVEDFAGEVDDGGDLAVE